MLKAGLNCTRVTVLEFTFLNRDNIVGVLFRKHFTILDWLYRCVVMILVYFTINGSLGFFMAVFGDGFVHDCRSNFFVYSSIVVTGLGPGTM